MSKTKAILVRIPAEDHAVLSSMSKSVGRSITAQTRYMLMAVAASKNLAPVPAQPNLIGSEAWMRSEERKAWDQFMAAGISAGYSASVSAHSADQALKLRQERFK